MSSLRDHTIQSAVACAALYPFIGSHVIPFGLTVILIDVDHLIDYVRQTGSWKLLGVFPCSKIIEKNMNKGFLVLNIFHTVEFFLLVGLLSLLHPVFFYMLAGMLYHLALDVFYLGRAGILFQRALSILEYFFRIRRGRYITTVSTLIQRNDVDLSEIRNLDFWLNHWGKTKPGLTLKN